MDLGYGLSHVQKSLYGVFRDSILELVMSKKKSKVKPKKRSQHLEVINLVAYALKVDLKILEKALDLTNDVVDKKIVEKEKLIKKITNDVLYDYGVFISTTYLCELKENHEKWINTQTRYVFWLVFLEYLKNNEVRGEYRREFYSLLFKYIKNLNDKNLLFLINRNVFRKNRYQVNKEICKTDFLKFFRLPKNFFN